MTEVELIQACIENNQRAQKRLFDEFSPRLMGVCLRYASGRDEANDMLQDGFIKIFQKLETYNGKGSFAGWLHRTVVNTCLDQIRKNTKFLSHVEIEKAEYQAFSDETTLSQLHTQELLNLIQQLPNGYKVVFNMFGIEGYSHKEIAEMLGISESTSKSQYRKARLTLQKAVRDLDKIA